MKTAKSEEEFDKTPQTCPFRKYPCVKDDCTHFILCKDSYETNYTTEEYNYATCQAGKPITLWYETIKKPKPIKTKSWFDWLIDVFLAILFIALIIYLCLNLKF